MSRTAPTTAPVVRPEAKHAPQRQLLPAALLIGVVTLLTMCFATARYDVGPTATLVALILAGVVLAAVWSGPLTVDRGLLGGVILAVAVAQAVPGWSYLEAGTRDTLMMLMTGVAAIGALALILVGGRADRWVSIGAAGAVALLGGVALAATTPDIDVYDFVRDASRHVFSDNIYTRTWESSGIDDGAVHPGFPYFPMTAVALAPAGLLLSDPRWGLLAGLLVCWAVLYTRRGAGPGLGLLLLVLPGTLLMLQSTWTEPLVAALLLPALVLLPREGRQGWLGVLLLAAAIATKQHVLLLTPILVLWPAVGLRKVVATAAVSLGLVLPWLLLDARAFFDATVTDMVEGPKRPDSISLWIMLDRMGIAPPYALMTVVVLATAVLLAVVVRRRDLGVQGVAFACAAMLLVANLANKQAFYNQYWLVAALVLLALACGPDATDDESGQAGLADGVPIEDERAPV